MRRRYLLILLLLAPVFYWLFLNWRDHRFDAVIAVAAHRYQVDPALIKAVIWRESRFNPDARGAAGELGLMQIRKTAAQEWAAAEHIPGFEHSACLNPATNTLAGAWYLHKLLRRYQQADNPAAYALADYNAGRGNVLKWRNGAGMTNSATFMGQIGFPGTRAYVAAILNRSQDYR